MADDGLDIQISGLDELQAQLDDLGTKAAERCIRKALRAGAAIEQAAIVERAPVKVGDGGILPENALRNDIVVKVKREDDDSLSAVVGPDKFTAHVARWVEYGHRQVNGGYSRKTKSGKYRGPGKQIGDVPEHPFLRPAWEATQTEVTDTICTTLAAEIEQAAKRKGTT